jgi:hypothetical protein
MLDSKSVQEAMDFALIAQSATLETRVPFLHFFDGFRTSHEVQKIEELTPEDMRAMIPEDRVLEHRRRGLSPDRPAIRGTSQNPDVYFQGRETVNRFCDSVPHAVQMAMDQFAALTGRQYRLFEYYGDPDAELLGYRVGETGAGGQEGEAAVGGGSCRQDGITPAGAGGHVAPQLRLPVAARRDECQAHVSVVPAGGADYKVHGSATDASYGWMINATVSGSNITVHHLLTAASGLHVKAIDTDSTKMFVESVDEAAGTAVLNKNNEVVGRTLTFTVTLVSIA